jgi:hypothetical protein
VFVAFFNAGGNFFLGEFAHHFLHHFLVVA